MGFGRNLVLGLWEKDVQHLLMVTDCGVSEEASGEEPPRASLVREIYRFLDYHVSVMLSQEPCMLFDLWLELVALTRNGVCCMRSSCYHFLRPTTMIFFWKVTIQFLMLAVS